MIVRESKARAAAGRLLGAAALVATLAGCSSLSSMMPTWLGGVAEKPKMAELAPNVPVVPVRLAWSSKIGNVDFPLSVNVNGGTITLGRRALNPARAASNTPVALPAGATIKANSPCSTDAAGSTRASATCGMRRSTASISASSIRNPRTLTC